MDRTRQYSVPSKQNQILTAKTRTGDLAPYAQKLAAEFFVFLSSLITLGATADFARVAGSCGSACRYVLIVGLVSTVILSLILIFNYLGEMNKLSRQGWYSHRFEMRLLGFVAILCWVPGAATISSRSTLITTGTGVTFGWLSFFGCLYATYTCYRAMKEEETLAAIVPDLEHQGDAHSEAASSAL
mmetsp:Transcript_5279/g.10827  ORF Transcript_5279/g.10827 Transcript_5279/m.10827 type:complete len:186 (-) Transcript_5279:2404-2961(-)